MIHIRFSRVALLDRFFETEKNILLHYHAEKSKKQKKPKPIFASLQALHPAAKQTILRNYYENKIVSENLTTAIYYHATVCKARGERGEPGDPGYGLLTELEHKNLKSLKKNIKLATTFLFKGTKEAPPVGGEDEDGHRLPLVAPWNAGAGPGEVGGAMDLASLVAAAKDVPDPGNAPTEPAATKASGAEKRSRDGKKDSKADKSGSRPKSTSKGRATTTSPARKAAKKKKPKEAEIDVDWAIPEGVTRGLNLFLPDRGTMQRLVLRAAALKETEDEPLCEMVRPWERLQNQDVYA